MSKQTKINETSPWFQTSRVGADNSCALNLGVGQESISFRGFFKGLLFALVVTVLVILTIVYSVFAQECYSEEGTVLHLPFESNYTDIKNNLFIVERGSIGYNTGFVGTALEINSTSESLIVLDSPLLEPSSFTITFWAYPYSLGESNLGVVASKDTTNGYYVYTTSAGYLSAYVGGTQNTNNPTFILNGWNFYALTFNGSDELSYLYINSTASTVFNVSKPSYSTGNFTIGDRASDWARNYNGRIDELILWNYTLSPDNISSVFDFYLNATRPCPIVPDVPDTPNNDTNTTCDQDCYNDKIDEFEEMISMLEMIVLSLGFYFVTIYLVKIGARATGIISAIVGMGTDFILASRIIDTYGFPPGDSLVNIFLNLGTLIFFFGGIVLRFFLIVLFGGFRK